MKNPYKEETIRKVVTSLRDLIRVYRGKSYKEIRLHISAGNRKIGRVHNFSLAPIITCANCSGCCRWCYDIKACLQYKNVRIARAENTAAMEIDRPATFAAIDRYIASRRANKFFRWHVSGDILDVDYFDRMVQIARNHTDWVFWTYTKNYMAVNAWLQEHGGKKALPRNLSVMYSVWQGMPCVNPYGMPEFTCVMEGQEPDPDTWTCPGNCDVCLKARRGCPYRESSQVGQH